MSITTSLSWYMGKQDLVADCNYYCNYKTEVKEFKSSKINFSEIITA